MKPLPSTLLPLLLILLAPSPTTALNILLTNDDGWATLSIRTLYTYLSTTLSHALILSAPASNRSGSSSLDIPPLPRLTPCQFSSCPAPGPAVGTDPEDGRLQYVNSFPVTSVKEGFGRLAPEYFGERGVELVVSGPNVGSNLDVQVPFSGTVGAAVEAVKRGVPAVAVSGRSGEQVGFGSVREGEEAPVWARNYAEATGEVVSALSAGRGEGRLLPQGVWLNVNMPVVEAGRCEDVGTWRYVLTRINPGVLSGRDVETCGNGGRLPTERSVVDREDGCYVAVSVGDADDKTTADAERQADVLERLGGFLSCLP